MRRSLAVAAIGALLTAVAAATPAQAACAVGDPLCTDVSFTLVSGTITVAAPTAASAATSAVIGSAGTVSIVLGATSVTDTRLPTSGWSVSATASDFTSGSDVIPKANAAFSVPADATWVTCTGTKTRLTTPTAVNASGTTAGLIGCAQTTGSGATYNPTLTVTIPGTAVAGTYTGTVTQSVS